MSLCGNAIIADFDRAIPCRPVCRGSTDASFNHWHPTEFHVGARELLSSVVDRAEYNVSNARLAVGSDPLVEVGMVSADGIGAVLPCVNWAADAIAGFSVELLVAFPYREATLASGKPVRVSQDRHTFTFDLADDADALILR